MLTTGTEFQDGRYIIVSFIDRGGMGEVYKAKDNKYPEITIAIKEIWFNSDDKKVIAQFNREATLLRSLRHSSLPKVYDHFIEAGSGYIVMDYVDGQDLLDILNKQANLFTAEQIKSWGLKLLDTIQYLHSQSPPIIHRDIKPKNIKLTSSGQLFLLDFGLARQMSVTLHSILSVPGFTISYASPEQISSKRTDERSDLYSLGATLFHLLANREPINAQVREQVINRTATDPMKEMFDSLPTPFNSVLCRAMEMNPASRFTSAEEMLKQLLNEDAQPVDQLHRKDIILRWILILSVLGLLGVIFWYWISERQHNPVPPVRSQIQRSSPSSTTPGKKPEDVTRESSIAMVVDTHYWFEVEGERRKYTEANLPYKGYRLGINTGLNGYLYLVSKNAEGNFVLYYSSTIPKAILFPSKDGSNQRWMVGRDLSIYIIMASEPLLELSQVNNVISNQAFNNIILKASKGTITFNQDTNSVTREKESSIVYFEIAIKP